MKRHKYGWTKDYWMRTIMPGKKQWPWQRLVFGHAAEPSNHEFPKVLKNSGTKIKCRQIQKGWKTYF